MTNGMHSNLLLPGFHKPSFIQGAQHFIPVSLGVIPYAMVLGVLMIDTGIAFWDALGMTLIMWTGVAQVVALDLMQQNAPVLIIIFTALMVNLRYLMYSASLAPHLKSVPTFSKGLLSFAISDQSYALAMVRFAKGDTATNNISYYAGASLCMYVLWILAVASGMLLGAAIPPAWSLDFALPVTFIALLGPNLQDRPNCHAALMAACVAIIAKPLPWGLGLVCGAFAGILTGTLTSREKSHGPR